MNGEPIELDDGKHECPYPGCEIRVDYNMLGCKDHWFVLPRRLRNRIWKAWTAAQADGINMGDYLEVRAEAVKFWEDTANASR